MALSSRNVFLIFLLFSIAVSKSPVRHVIVLMMENRSFDHFLGHLAKGDPRIDGLNGSQYNPINPADPSSQKMPVNYNAVDGGPDDPCHEFDCITQQIFGFNKRMNDTTSPVHMSGFVANALAVHGSAPFVMSAFTDTNLPVLSTLAKEYAVFDHWYCSCPCPTNPNREFLMSGTSHGMTVNTIPDEGFPQETHFAFLERHNISWKIYYHDDPWMAPTFADLRVKERLALVQEMPAFYEDIKGGTLPQYVLIQPRMATSKTGPSNWQHPDNSVEQGEILMTEVYEALRNSSYWEESLLIITYDEHGGFFDHQNTPIHGVPAPDDIKSVNGFDFSRLGVRIPTVMVSPWIARGTVVSRPSGARAPTSTSQYDATSIISSANKIFGIYNEHMSHRDAWAGTFHDLVSGEGESALRRDCPYTLPSVQPLSHPRLEMEMNMPFNDHHYDSINLLCHLSGHPHPVCSNFAHTSPTIISLSGPSLDRVREKEQKDYAHKVSGGKPLKNGVWQGAQVFPHLYPPAAAFLRQKDFEELSKFLFRIYRSKIMLA